MFTALYVVFVVALIVGLLGEHIVKQFPSVWPPTRIDGVRPSVWLVVRIARLVTSASYVALFLVTKPIANPGPFGMLSLFVFGWIGVVAVHDLNQKRRWDAEIAEATRQRDDALRRLEETQKLRRRAQLHPEDEEAHRALAGMRQHAIQELQRLAQLHPRDDEVRRLLASVEEQAKRPDHHAIQEDLDARREALKKYDF